MAQFFNLFKRLPYGSVGIAAILFAVVVSFLPASIHQASQDEIVAAQAVVVTSAGALLLPILAFFSLVVIPAIRGFISTRRNRKVAV